MGSSCEKKYDLRRFLIFTGQGGAVLGAWQMHWFPFWRPLLSREHRNGGILRNHSRPNILLILLQLHTICSLLCRELMAYCVAPLLHRLSDPEHSQAFHMALLFLDLV